MSSSDMRLIGECSTWLSIVSQLFSVRMGKMLKPYGMTLAQFSIFHHIAQQKLTGDMRISDIAAAVEVGQPAVTKAIAKFESKGLVELVGIASDRRVKKVIVKPEAIALLGEIREGIGPELFQVFCSIENSELEQFAKNLKQLGQWLDKNRLPTST